ncbi:hypothetical protein RRG08_004483 [Elysia crispata]|uniref:Uncharacterized protein n=1 Tax=Elysia crispata TaxID=231223 RepID=A0AAE1B9K6_9GAST|nr:hypothetical protein RRG08_004483 [Elysia crispata]
MDQFCPSCLAVEDGDSDKEIFELNENGHKEGLEGRWQFLRIHSSTVNNGCALKQGMNCILRHIENVFIHWYDIIVGHRKGFMRM